MSNQTFTAFRSRAFDSSVSKPGFVRPDDYGDDLVQWFMKRLGERGAAVDRSAPEQEDHGRYCSFEYMGRNYDFVARPAPVCGEEM